MQSKRFEDIVSAVWISVGMMLILFPIYSRISRSLEIKRIRSNPLVRIATIDSVANIEYHGKGSYHHIEFHYYYTVQNDSFRCSVQNDYNNYFPLIINKKIPVIVSQKDASEHQLLLFWSEYNKFNLVIPDSLKWTKKLFYDK